MDREFAVVDLGPVASLTGLPGVVRKGRVDLQLVEQARETAAKVLGRSDANLVIAVLDAHSSIAALRGREIIDASNYLENGPLSLLATGALPAREVVQLCMGSGLSKQEVLEKLACEGGVKGHTGICSFEELDRRVRSGDICAESVLDTMVYQVAREIGAMVAALGHADAIVISGCGSEFECITKPLTAKVERLSKVLVSRSTESARCQECVTSTN